MWIHNPMCLYNPQIVPVVYLQVSSLILCSHFHASLELKSCLEVYSLALSHGTFIILGLHAMFHLFFPFFSKYNGSVYLWLLRYPFHNNYRKSPLHRIHISILELLVSFLLWLSAISNYVHIYFKDIVGGSGR